MLRYEIVKDNRRKFLAITGLTPEEFEIILPAFREAYQRTYPETKTKTGAERQRKTGAGRKGALDTLEQKLLFALAYQKDYPLQELLGEVFGISQGRANEWIHRLLPILKQALDDLGVLPERDPQELAQHEQDREDAADLIIDGTERRRQRPKKAEKQALHYSGKKKIHSDKNVLVAAARTKRIAYLSQTYPGKMHDKKVADTEALSYPENTTLYKDTGFQGYEPQVRETRQPKKSLAKRN
jgi:hypothetical protein